MEGLEERSGEGEGWERRERGWVRERRETKRGREGKDGYGGLEEIKCEIRGPSDSSNFSADGTRSAQTHCNCRYPILAHSYHGLTWIYQCSSQYQENLTTLYLDDEVAYDSAIIGVHAGTEGVEDTSYSDLNLGLTLIGIPTSTWVERESGEGE